MKCLSLILMLVYSSIALAQQSSLQGNEINELKNSVIEEANEVPVPSDAINNEPSLYGSNASQSMRAIFGNLSSAYQIGLVNADVKYGDVTTRLTGLQYHIEWGFHIHYGVTSDNRITSLSFHLAFMKMNASGKYTDTGNINRENKYKMSYFGLPISYTGILGANSTIGFYYQLGISPQIQVSAKQNKDKTSLFKTFVMYPYASIGIAIPKLGKRGGDTKFKLIGPYISSTLGDISRDKEFSFNVLNYGLRYTSFFVK